MPFSPKAHASLFSTARRRQSLAQGEECETLSSPTTAVSSSFGGLQASGSSSLMKPFHRASFSVERSGDDEYQSPGSLPSSRRPSAATIISSLLHGVGVGGSSSAVRLSQDGSASGGGYTSSDEGGSSNSGSANRAAQGIATGSNQGVGVHARRPSAIFKAWKARRASNSTQGQASSLVSSPVAPPSTTGGFAQGRRKSSALTRVLQQPHLAQPVRSESGVNLGSTRVDEHAFSSSFDDGRRRSLSIICRGERGSDELDPSDRREFADSTTRFSSHTGTHGGTTAAMAIRDTWLYGAHQWTPDGRKGSVSTVATSPTYSSHLAPNTRKSISGFSAPVAVGLDMEDQQIQHQQLQERLRQLRRKAGASESSNEAALGGGDATSVVSLSLTEEIALYTSDVQAVEYNAGKARRSANSSGSALSMTRGQPQPQKSHQSQRGNVNNRSGDDATGAFVWNLPEWSAPYARAGGNISSSGAPRLPELSPAPAIMLADPFSRIADQQLQYPLEWEEEGGPKAASMQRPESGSLDPVLSPMPASNSELQPIGDVGASEKHQLDPAPAPRMEEEAVQWALPQWNAASPFRPQAPALPTVSAQRSSFSTAFQSGAEEDQSPTAPNFPPTSPSREASARRATTYYDASSHLHVVDEGCTSPTSSSRATVLPDSPTAPPSPASPRSFGMSERSYEMKPNRKRISYSIPRPPHGYEQTLSPPSAHATLAALMTDDDSEHMPTPRLGSIEFGETSSPMSSNFAPQTPSNVAAKFPQLPPGSDGDETLKLSADEGEDLHDQFCSVLLLDLGNGTAIPLSQSSETEPTSDPITLLAH